MLQPLRLNIPSEIITQRLLLRIPRIEDGQLILPAIRDSLPELKAWMPWASDGYDLSDAEDWCRRSAAKHILGEEASYLICPRGTALHIGNVSSFAKDLHVPKFEIGYWLATTAVGHGYMTEAVVAVTKMTLETIGARRIEIHTDSRNDRSRRVAERAGYVLEGAQLNDKCMYALAR